MSRTLVIGCGALAHELVAVLRASGWDHTDVSCLPASWHNTPERIVPAVEAKILAARETHDRVLVAYGDCGTGGQLDAMLARHRVPRLPGAHCYAFFAGLDVFDALAEAEPGTFYLTDYLARNFERLILDELGIRRHPELLEAYFGNYTRVLYLAQAAPEDDADGAEALRAARAAAAALGLPLEVRRTGLAPFGEALHAIRIAPAPAAIGGTGGAEGPARTDADRVVPRDATPSDLGRSSP